MEWRKRSREIALSCSLAVVALAGCGGGGSRNVVIVNVVPAAATVVVNQQQPFGSSVTGATNTNVTWQLTISGNACSPGCGTLDSTTNPNITYTAPATVPGSLKQAPGSTTTPPSLILTATSVANKKKTGTAMIALDSGIRVGVTPPTATVASGATGFPPEHFQFHASTPNDTSANPVTWLVTQASTLNAAAASCSPGCGKVDSNNGVYTGPSTLPSNTAVTVLAFDKIDTTRFATATVTLVDPTKNKISFTGITPSIAPLGGFQQDVYLAVTNLRSTISVRFDGGQIDPNSGQLKIVNATVARLRLNSAQLSAAGLHTISVVDQQGNAQNQSMQIVAVRPAVIAAVPNSITLNSGSPLPVPENLDGGFFGAPGSPVISLAYSGGNLGIPVPGSRQLSFNLSPGNKAGLFPLSVTNSFATPSTAVTNIAIQPDLVATLPQQILGSPLALPGPTGNATVPSAIAVDSTLGLAVITEQASNSIQIVNLAGGTLSLTGCAAPATPCAQVTSTLNQPTGVAIDDQLSTTISNVVNHVAAVVNGGNSTVTILQIPSGNVLGTASLASLIPAQSGATAPTPFAIGIDPFTHLALVAFSSTNVGFIININQANANPGCIGGKAPPFCPIASVSLNTGRKPQIAFEPRLHLAFVTPGGAGLMSVVDLTQKNSIVPIAAAPSGAVRTNNVVTINTGSTPHNINPAVLGTVLITGASPADFNGSFQVTSVIDPFTFTYSQTAPDETGGGGTVSFGNPDLNFSVSATDQGIAINPETRTAVVADPNASFGQITFINTLDEGLTSLTLSAGAGSCPNPAPVGTAPEPLGATYVGFQPFTNVAVSFNPNQNANQVSFIDPVRLQRLALACTGQTAIGSYTPPGASSAVTVTGGLAVDPVTNLALVVNSGSNNLQAFSIGGGLKPVHIRQVQVFTTGGSPYEIPGAILPQAVLSTNSSLPPGVATPALGTVKILGTGFDSNSTVRLDSVSITTQPGGSVVLPPNNPGTELDVTIPASFLGMPRHFALDVINSAGVGSNATDFTVVQTIDVSGGCSGAATPQPSGVAIDEQRNFAVVTNNGCNDASILDLTPGLPANSVVKKSVAVGKAPLGVAVIPRMGLAVITNNGDGTASVVNLDTATVTAPVTIGTSPMGVAIDQDTGAALIANNGSNTVSLVDLSVLQKTPPGKLTAISGAVDQSPIAVAIDPDRGTNAHGLAVVTALQLNGTLPPSGVVDAVDIGGGSPARNSSASVSSLSATPTGVLLDQAVSPALFYVTSSEGNMINAFNPDNTQLRTALVGINPTSLAYNPQTGTIITVNTASNTISILDSQTFQTRATFGIGGSPLFAVAIHPRTNMAVIADQTNNRVVVYPLP